MIPVTLISIGWLSKRVVVKTVICIFMNNNEKTLVDNINIDSNTKLNNDVNAPLEDNSYNLTQNNNLEDTQNNFDHNNLEDTTNLEETNKDLEVNTLSPENNTTQADGIFPTQDNDAISPGLGDDDVDEGKGGITPNPKFSKKNPKFSKKIQYFPRKIQNFPDTI